MCVAVSSLCGQVCKQREAAARSLSRREGKLASLRPAASAPCLQPHPGLDWPGGDLLQTLESGAPAGPRQQGGQWVGSSRGVPRPLGLGPGRGSGEGAAAGLAPGSVAPWRPREEPSGAARNRQAHAHGAGPGAP